MTKAYKVILSEKSKVEWVTLEHGKEVRYTNEPDTSFWKRFGVDIMNIFVPESQL